MKPGRKTGAYSLHNKRKTLPRQVIEGRIRELCRINTEASKAEAARLAVHLMPYEEPRLQAVMAQVQTMGDTLNQLLKEIDGGTTGITTGRPSLAPQQLIYDPGQDGEDDPVPTELGATELVAEFASVEPDPEG